MNKLSTIITWPTYDKNIADILLNYSVNILKTIYFQEITILGFCCQPYLEPGLLFSFPKEELIEDAYYRSISKKNTAMYSTVQYQNPPVKVCNKQPPREVVT